MFRYLKRLSATNLNYLDFNCLFVCLFVFFQEFTCDSDGFFPKSKCSSSYYLCLNGQLFIQVS